MARKILLADDSVTAQNMGRKILADAGYEVVTVNNGSAALKRVAEISPDLILLDVYMPGYSGLEVCQRLKDADQTCHIPILLTVGKLEPFKADEARRVRADGHIVKPFEASELLAAIGRLARSLTSPGQSPSYPISENHDSDPVWKGRVSFPSAPSLKKRIQEPEAPAQQEPAKQEDEIPSGSSFRDFRKLKSKSAVAESITSPIEESAPTRDAAIVPDIPRDITPDELDALSALASKLGHSVPEPEPEAANQEAAVATKPKAADCPAPVVANAAPTRAIPDFVVEGKGDVEIPAAPAGPPARDFPFSEAAAAEKLQAAPQPDSPAISAIHPQIPAAAGSGPDRVEDGAVHSAGDSGAPGNDQSGFARPASPLDLEAQPTGEPENGAFENDPHESGAHQDVVHSSEAVAASPLASSEAALWSDLSTPLPPDFAASLREGVPSDAELVEALRLLTPATGSADVQAVPTHGTLAAAGQLLLEEAARNAAAAPRWFAERVGLTPEEATASLEDEMLRSLAPAPASLATELEAGQISSVSEIASAVAHRMAQDESLTAGRAPAEEAVQSHQAENQPETLKSVRNDAPHGMAAVAAQRRPQTEDLPKAMAAAAAESSTTASAPDAGTIARIVDSVMADLRPKIMEEITKKLANR